MKTHYGEEGPAADRCGRRRHDGFGIGVPHHRERRCLIPTATPSRERKPLSLSPLLASHAEGFHLRVLLEPCVNLSVHTAPDVRLPTLKNRQ